MGLNFTFSIIDPVDRVPWELTRAADHTHGRVSAPKSATEGRYRPPRHSPQGPSCKTAGVALLTVGRPVLVHALPNTGPNRRTKRFRRLEASSGHKSAMLGKIDGNGDEMRRPAALRRCPAVACNLQPRLRARCRAGDDTAGPPFFDARRLAWACGGAPARILCPSSRRLTAAHRWGAARILPGGGSGYAAKANLTQFP